jgi:hypothetical protein
MPLPPDDRSHCCSMVVVAIIREEVVFVIVVCCCSALVEECSVEEFLSGRTMRFAWKLTRHSTLELQALFDECHNSSKDYKYQRQRDAGSCFEGGEENVSNRERVRHDGP